MVGGKRSPLLPRRKRKPPSTAEKAVKQPNTKAPSEDTEIPSVPTRPPKARRPHMARGVKPSAPQQQLTAEEKRVLRRRRARRRMLIRIAILVAVCALAVVVWLNWSSLAPDRVWAWLQDLFGGGTGSYPVDLSGSGARRLEQVDGYTVVLTDSYLMYLDEDGAEMKRYGCAYSQPLLRTEGKYVLVAEQDGQRLLLTTRSKQVLELKTGAQQDGEEDLTVHNTFTIRAVALNALGQIAVLTDGPQGYAVQIKVYDAEGNTLYTRSSNRTAVDIALSPDGTTVALTSVEATDGTLDTRLEVFSLTSAASDAQCTHTAQDALLYRIGYLSDGTVVAVSDGGVTLMDPSGGKTTTYKPEGMRVLGYALGGDTVALALRPYGDTTGGEVRVLSSAGKVKSTVSFDGEFRHLSGHDGRYALLTDSTVYAVTASGSKGKVAVPGDGRQALYVEDNVLVMGINRLDAYRVK